MAHWRKRRAGNQGEELEAADATMTHDLSARIEYSEKYVDDTHEYRCVVFTMRTAAEVGERSIADN